MRLLIVGLDAADHLWVKTFWGSMPNLRRLAERGSFGPLKSTDFPSSPRAWSCVYTGCSLEEHGISGFRKDGIGPIRVRPFWERIQSMSIGLMNLPLVSAKNTKVPQLGFIVPGFSAPPRWFPQRLAESGYVIDSTNQTRGRARWLYGPSARLRHGVKDAQIRFLGFNREVELKRTQLAIKYAKRFGVDMMFVGLMLIDRIGHAFAHHRDTMEDTYRTVDGLLGRLIKATKPKLVVVVSDHGMDSMESNRIPETVLKAEASRRRHNPDKLRARGQHTMEGIVCFSGAGVGQSVIENAELRDVAPTLTHMIAGTVPDPMSGRVLDVCTTGYSASDQEMLDKTLQALGYV